MATQEFLLPDVGEGLEAGTIVQWLVSPGDTVTVDQIIVEIETDKALVEIPAPVSGTLATHGGKVGASLPVGSVLATFETDATAPAATSKKASSKTPTEATPQHLSDSASPSQATASAEKRIKASPATRKFARNNHCLLYTSPSPRDRG